MNQAELDLLSSLGVTSKVRMLNLNPTNFVWEGGVLVPFVCDKQKKQNKKKVRNGYFHAARKGSNYSTAY